MSEAGTARADDEDTARNADSQYQAWQELNREYVIAALGELRSRLESAGALDPAEDARAADKGASAVAHPAAVAARMARPPALAQLADTFGLTAFERDLVLLCLGAEVAPRVLPPGTPVTVGWALDALPGSHWTALATVGTLRYWEIIELDESALLAGAELRLSADIVSHLLGFPAFPDLSCLFTPADPVSVVFPRQSAAAGQLLRAAAMAAQRTGRPPVIELAGADEDDRVELATGIADLLDSSLSIVDVRDLPPPGPDLDRLVLRWARHARLADVQLLVRTVPGEAWPNDDRLRRLLSGRVPLALISTARSATQAAAWPVVRHHVEPLSTAERGEVWAAQLRLADPAVRLAADSGELLELASQFRLGSIAIAGVCSQAQAVWDEGASAEEAAPGSNRFVELLRDGCRRIVRARLDPVAERVDLRGLHHVELAEQAREQFVELAMTVRLHHRVNEQWGMGLGGREAAPVALFAGPSGTGKTHAALALAQDLGLDLYRVNVARVLSKWVGETEQNFEAIFEGAALGGAILLFDEADALFGKRSEVNNSHDRYANLSASYLLQQVERAAVPMILTTNMKNALDPAFTRRLHFIIDFPFPEAATRERIWRAAFPPTVPSAELDPAQLARVVASGGTIRNIARRAAFMAAADDQPVTMARLRESAKREARKLDRDLSPDELAGWA